MDLSSTLSTSLSMSCSSVSFTGESLRKGRSSSHPSLLPFTRRPPRTLASMLQLVALDLYIWNVGSSRRCGRLAGPLGRPGLALFDVRRIRSTAASRRLRRQDAGASSLCSCIRPEAQRRDPCKAILCFLRPISPSSCLSFVAASATFSRARLSSFTLKICDDLFSRSLLSISSTLSCHSRRGALHDRDGGCPALLQAFPRQLSHE